MQSTLASMSQVYEKTDQNLANSSESTNYGLGLTKKLKMPLIMHKSTTLLQTLQENLVSKEKPKHEKQSLNTQDVECKLFSLHSRLRQEAEKIREWKLSTEAESKQKEKKIGELTQTIENLRKSFIELQIENENLSQKMQEEISNREEILKKIDFTRKMCNIVKEHSQTVENKMMQCEAESNELKYKEREHFEKFEELSVKFNDLNISAKDEENKLKNEINNIVQEKEKQRKVLEKRIADMQNINKELQNEISCRNEKLEQLNKDLHDAKEEKDQLKFDYEESKKCLSEVEFKYTTLKFETTEKSNEALLIMASSENLLKEANEAYEKLEKECGELNVKYTSANKMIEDLKSDKDILVLENAELSENLKQEISYKDNLLAQLNSKSAKINNLNSNIILLNDEIVNAKALNVDAADMHEKTKEKLKTLEEKYKTLSNESEVLKGKFQEKVEQLNEALKNIEELKKTSSVESNELTNIISELRNENNLLEDEISNLKTQMKNHESKYSSHIGKLNKTIEENAISFSKYADIVKAKETEIEEYKDKLQTIQKEIDECQQEKVVLMGYQEELKQMTILKENAVQDKERILKVSENQKEEMVNTLEKYKKENQKIFDIKTKEIYAKNESEIKEQKLKHENDLKEKTSEFEKEILQYKSEISELRQNVQYQMENNIQLEEKIDIMLKEKENMKKEMYENTMQTVFPTRKQPQVAVLMTPQHPINMTPSRINVNSFKSNFLTSKKRKVVFNSDDMMLVSDSDSSVSECQRNDKITIRTPLLKQHQKNINSPKKDNVSDHKLEEVVLTTGNQQNLENNISARSRKTRTLTGNNKTKKSPVKQNLNTVKPKRANVKKSETQPVKKFFKSPKSKRSLASSIDKYAWFDMDSVFGFGSDD
ncbi:synaptonemal complex protein 1-like [Octopus sinensis]|uniref:Synaptonemal complex protein 1-like n=1 Tax=Octopus sinensis TaxID=2607531 RepID=A0A7E6F0U4_9MOLL|nr:synaptonemal complex protein 1-like [Octopus sinensis]